MTLNDEIDKETQSVNKQSIEQTVQPFSFLSAAEEYINSHPDKNYGKILNSGDTKEKIYLAMKQYVFKKIIEEITQSHNNILPTTEKYGRWVEEQKQYIEDLPFMDAPYPEEMRDNYKMLLDTNLVYGLAIKEELENAGFKTIEKKRRRKNNKKNK